MKRKRTSSLKSSHQNLAPSKFTEKPMKKKKITSSSSQQLVDEEEIYSNLPDDCWECVFKFLFNNKDNYRYTRRYLKSLSAVSKQFLSITNRIRVSFIVYDSARHFLPCVFQRFTNLTSLNLSYYNYDLDKLLRKISRFPLNITSLNISNHHTNSRKHAFPTNGLRAFSRKVTTLTSLDCSDIDSLISSHLLLIADCFPKLKQLNLGHSLNTGKNDTDFINGIYSLLSKCRCIQHLDLNNSYFLNDLHVAEFSLFLHELVSINLNSCLMLTKSTLFSLLSNCPSLSEIKMEHTSIKKKSVENSDSLTDIGVYPQLKSLYFGHNSIYFGHNSWLSDESIISFASIFPSLQHLELRWCDRISEGICQVLRRCCNIRHLNLTGCSRVKLLGINFAVPQLEVLNLSDTMVDDETLYVISKNCSGLLKLLLRDCYNVTEKGAKHVIENCTQLREIYLRVCIHLTDKTRELFTRRGCLVR